MIGIELILIALAVSVDAFWAGLAVGMRRERIGGLHLASVPCIVWPCVFLAISIAHAVRTVISLQIAQYLGASLLIGVGIYALVDALHKPNAETSAEHARIGWCACILMALAVSLDGAVAAFSLGLRGVNPWWVAALFACTHCLLIWLGNMVALRGLARFSIPRIRVVGALVLIVLGGLRFL